MFFSPVRMHIPDGFLSIGVSIFFWLIAIGVISYALRRVNREMGERQVPLMGVLAACIFAGQMLNFSVTGGTSGHLLGAALATILLGPWAAILIMTCVVGTQALIFQDGGILALGANLFNMAIVGSLVSYFVYQTVRKVAGKHSWSLWVGGFIAAWASIFTAALACALQLAFSGTSPANIAVPAMAGIHALIGIGEGLITVGALSLIYAVRRDLVQETGTVQPIGRSVVVAGLLLALGLTIAAPLASTHPDGLEWVAEQHGFLETMQVSFYSLIPDYALPGIENQKLATILAGGIGVLIVFFAVAGGAYLRRLRRNSGAPHQI